MRTRYCVVGRVIKTHGKQGAVMVRPQAGFQHPLQKDMAVALVPPTLRDDRYQQVSSVAESPKGQIVRFASIANRASAFDLVGRWVLAKACDVEREDQPVASEWVGLTVRDIHQGPLGLVRSVETGGGQPLLVVESARGTLLIPAVAPLVVEQTGQELVVDCPEGLLSLNEDSSY